MIATNLQEMSTYFGKTRNAVQYQISLGRLPDPRVQGVDLESLTWPGSQKVGRKPGSKNRVTKLVMNDLIIRIEALENRISQLENISGEHG